MSNLFRVTLDAPQNRVTTDRQCQLVQADRWDLASSPGGVWREPVTQTVMLAPNQLLPAWQTNSAGVNARLRKTDWTCTGTAWSEVQVRLAGDYYLQALGTNEVISTVKADYPVNQGWLVSAYLYGPGNAVFEALECGWGTVFAAGCPGFRVWSDGRVQCYHGTSTVPQGEGNITGTISMYPQATGMGAVGGSAVSGGAGANLAGRRVDILFLPYRQNEMLVWSNQGGAFNWVYSDVPDATTAGTIAPGTCFWMQVTQGMAQVQATPVSFPASGTILSHPFAMLTPPPSGATPNVVGYSMDYGSGTVTTSYAVRGASGTALLVPNGTAGTAVLAITLNGGGVATPFLYGVAVEWGGSVTPTAGTAVDATSSMLRSSGFSLKVGDSGTDVTATFALKDPSGFEAASAPGLTEWSNRPIEAVWGSALASSGTVFRGVTPNVDMTYAQAVAAERQEFDCRDLWAQCENYRIRDAEPLDGLNLGTAWAKLLGWAGFGSADYDIEAVDFTLPTAPTASTGEYALLPEQGDTAADWIKRLHDDYAANWYVGFRPTASGYKFVARDPQGTVLGTAAMGTAVLTSADGPGVKITSYRHKMLQPETNDIWVTGYDKRFGRGVVSHWGGTASQDPTIAVAARTSDWLGEIRRFGLQDPAIQTQVVADRCNSTLQTRLGVSRQMAEFTTAGILVDTVTGLPLWRSDVVSIPTQGVFRIHTVEIHSDLETSATQHRTGTYTAEKL